MWKTKKLSANIKTLRKFVFTPHMLMRFWILSVEIKIVLTFLYVKMKSDMQGRIGTATFRLFLRKYKRQKLKFYLDLMMAHTTPQWIYFGVLLCCAFVWLYYAEVRVFSRIAWEYERDFVLITCVSHVTVAFILPAMPLQYYWWLMGKTT